jgi:nucleoside diphosphate kinase
VAASSGLDVIRSHVSAKAAAHTDVFPLERVSGLYLRGGHHCGDEKTHEPLQRTLAIIKPDAIEKAEEIKSTITSNGFKIVQSKRITLTKQQVYSTSASDQNFERIKTDGRTNEKQAQQFYREHEGKPFFDGLVAFMTSGICGHSPSLVRDGPLLPRAFRASGSHDPAEGGCCQGLACSHGTDQLEQGAQIVCNTSSRDSCK